MNYVEINRSRKHKLLPKDLEAKFPARYETNGMRSSDKRVVAKFFCPYSNWRWYAVEGERTDTGDFEFFGLVVGFEAEWGYFTLSQLDDVVIEKLGGVPGVERDLHFGDMNVADALRSDYGDRMVLVDKKDGWVSLRKG